MGFIQGQRRVCNSKIMVNVKITTQRKEKAYETKN